MTSILMQTWSTQMSEHAHVDGVYPFPAVMQTRTIETNGTSIHVRVGGHGPAVVMLHGFGTTGDMWGHLASALIEDHMRSEEHTSELQSQSNLVCRLLLE